jgi:hypothetical protein
MDEPTEDPKHYVLEVQSATIRGTSEVKAAEVEAPEEAEEKDDGEVLC